MLVLVACPSSHLGNLSSLFQLHIPFSNVASSLHCLVVIVSATARRARVLLVLQVCMFRGISRFSMSYHLWFCFSVFARRSRHLFCYLEQPISFRYFPHLRHFIIHPNWLCSPADDYRFHSCIIVQEFSSMSSLVARARRSRFLQIFDIYRCVP